MPIKGENVNAVVAELQEEVNQIGKDLREEYEAKLIAAIIADLTGLSLGGLLDK